MTDFGLSEKSINTILNIFSSYSKILKVIVYGSRAKGNYKAGSDIDMTIFHDGTLSHVELLSILNDFDDSDLPYLVDLSIFSELTNKDLIDHINRFGKIIYEKN